MTFLGPLERPSFSSSWPGETWWCGCPQMIGEWNERAMDKLEESTTGMADETASLGKMVGNVNDEKGTDEKGSVVKEVVGRGSG